MEEVRQVMSNGTSEAGGARAPEHHYLNHSSGWKSWLFTLDHKRIGIMYLCSVLLFFLVGGLLALLIRTELFTPQADILTEDQYNETFTLHGAIMVFLVIIPGIPATFGNFVLPLMLGAKDVAFPRLNLLSYHLYVFGAIFALASILTGGVDTGWTFYTPYSTETNTSVVAMITGAFILGFSSILTGLNFIVTIHKLRPPGMTWFRMPLFLWSLYGTAIIQVLATPVLGITLLLLIAERLLGIGIFDPGKGGDPVLFQHFFWFYSHPAVYIMILPAMGIISELVSVFSRKQIFGYKFIAYSSLAIALLGFLVWGHHMFTSGQSSLANAVFSMLTFSVSIPSAIKVFNWLATMYRGSIKLDTPMLWALAFIWIFGIGGLTGLFLGALSTDIHLHDTYFIVAHFHYTMVGTMVAFFGGLHYWWPKITGRMYSELWGKICWALIFVGFNVTFLAQFVMGGHGMPRRYATYDEHEGLLQFTIYHQISTVGSWLLGLGGILMLVYLIASLYRGKIAPANPWGGPTLEWRCSSPPPHDNFPEPPHVGRPYEYTGIRWDESSGGYIREGAPSV
jgi:cytochrome c oxidase subunit 1